MNGKRVRASQIIKTEDLNLRSDADVTEVVSRFVTLAEGVVAHWVEYAKGVLLFVMAPDDDRSGAFYIYDRKRGRFWLLDLADGVFGGYCRREMRRKIREFRLVRFAENPARLVPAREW
jgi:hypothetical protein